MNGISYSMTDTYAKCPKLFELKYIRNLQPIRMNDNLWKGIRAHDMFRDWYLLQRTDPENMPAPAEFIARWIDLFWTDYEGTPMFADEMEEAKEKVEEMGNYVQDFLERGLYDSWTILHVEEEFLVMLDGEVITFTPDLVAQDPDGSVWIIDHKTTSSHINRDALDIRPQPLFYFMGVREFYPDVVGFIHNYIRKKTPTEPRLNKTLRDGVRHVNNVKALDTTYEMLLEFLQKEAPALLDMEMYRKRLAELRDNNTFFFQHVTYMTDEMVRQATEDISNRLTLMHMSDEADLWPRTIQPFNACRSCDFQSLCYTELTGGNTEIVLQSYEERDPKNPYEQEEDDA